MHIFRRRCLFDEEEGLRVIMSSNQRISYLRGNENENYYSSHLALRLFGEKSFFGESDTSSYRLLM